MARRDSGELGILLPQDFCGKTMQAVTREPIKKIHFVFRIPTISYPESSGFLVSGATSLRNRSVTISIVLPQKSCGNKIRCPQSLPGVAPLTKKPEDSGYEIANSPESFLVTNRWPKNLRTLGTKLVVLRSVYLVYVNYCLPVDPHLLCKVYLL